MNAARADADHRLHGLEAGALRVVPRVEEAEDARAAVRLEPDREQAERRARAPTRRASSRIGTPATSRIAEHHHAERDRRAEVGLDQDQRAEDAGRRSPSGFAELAERPRRRPAREVGGGPDDERELRELRRLEASRARR